MPEPILIDPSLKQAWREAVDGPDFGTERLDRLVGIYREVGPEPHRQTVDDVLLRDALWASVVLSRTAFVVPEATIAVYDDLAQSYLAEGMPLRFGRRELCTDAVAALASSGTIASDLIDGVWTLIEQGVSPETITLLIAALGVHHPDSLRDAFARSMRQHPGFDEFRGRPAMPRLTLEAIENCAEGTLGHAVYRLIVDNGFDIEVLDPALVKDYHPELDDVNRYSLQIHEVWHLVAGYSTSPLHEVGISGFQLAQFGHPYSRDFLAVTTTMTAFTAPEMTQYLLQLTLEGWRHGRTTPPLTLVEWHRQWDQPMDQLREQIGIQVFESLIPDMPTAA